MNDKETLELLSEPVDINWDGTEKHEAKKLLKRFAFSLGVSAERLSRVTWGGIL